MLPGTSSWVSRPTANLVKKLEQDYLTNGGASPRDAPQIRKLLQANGIAVGLTDSELAQAALQYYQQEHPSPLASPRSSTGSPRSGGVSPRNGDAPASAITSPRSGKFPVLESRRRMSLAEFSGLADSMRRQSMILSKRTDEEDLVDQLRPRLNASRRSGATLDSASQTTTASLGSDRSTSTDDDEDEDDGEMVGNALGIVETTVFDPLTASAKSTDAELRGKTVSLKSLQKRLLSVGVPQGMAVLTGRSTENERFHGSQKLPISRLNELVGSRITPSNLAAGGPPAPLRAERHARASVGNATRGMPASPISAITDTATLFRRLGGDPTENGSVVSVARASLLVAAGALGGSVGETKAFLTALSQSEHPKLTFDAFLDVVNKVDMLLDIQPQPDSPFAEGSKSTGDGASESQDEGDDATHEELNATLTAMPAFVAAAASSGSQATPTAPSFVVSSFSGSHPTAAAQRGTSVVYQHHVLIHDAAAAFLSNLVQGGRRRSQFAHADRMRQKIAKTLNDHMARTKRDCTFVKGLSYVLRLDPMLLHAFILRFRPRVKSENFSGVALALRVLRVVEKVSTLVKNHETCQVCYLQVDVRKPQAANPLPKCANSAVVGCFTKLPRVPLEERPVVAAECISNLSSAAVSRKLKDAVGETAIHRSERQATAKRQHHHHPAPPPPPGSSTSLSSSAMRDAPLEATTHHISLRGCGFTAKTLATNGRNWSAGALRPPPNSQPCDDKDTRKNKGDWRHDGVQPRYLSHFASDEAKLHNIFDNYCRERSRRREIDDADRVSTHASTRSPSARSPRAPTERPLRGSYTGRHGFHF